MRGADEIEANKTLVRKFYDLSNQWKIEEMGEMFSEGARLRASLGSSREGRAEIASYFEKQRDAFPDYHCRIDEMLAVDDRVVTRMTYSGTQKGSWDDTGATGARFEYVGAAFWRFSGGLADEVWVVADTQAFWRALGKL